MRKRSEIESSGTRTDILILEVLLDIRDLLKEKKPKRKYVRTDGGK